MPIYEYQAEYPEKSCEYCNSGFEQLMKLSDPPVIQCPKCGNTVIKKISAPSVGSSKSGFDDRAKAAGFHKLKKLGKGEYEKTY
ncbi:MAG: zinc ribbon domain-containing protein [Kiritimatiellae bacterium]|nr:zinc ribbon domain-containing protein [Kiritimatiellia bacterium]MDD5521288.1 zinc ribbon domain-containing protein [Kiritimatiellia bacterium]